MRVTRRPELAKAAAQYTEALESLKKSARTVRDYGRILAAFGEFAERAGAEAGNGGAVLLNDITELVVAEWRGLLYEDGVSQNSIRHYLVVLHGFFEWAVRMGLSESNPVKAAEIPAESETRLDLLTLDEIENILEGRMPGGINKRTAARNRAVVVLLMQTGLRSDELRSLRPCDLDYENGTIKVVSGKGAKSRVTAFPALSRECVREYLDSGVRPSGAGESGYLFGSAADENGRESGTAGNWHKMSSAGLLGLVKRYVRNLTGHEGIGTHDLRHAYASYCDNRGVPMRLIQLSMGHSSQRTTERVYISTLDKAKAAGAVNGAFD